MDFRKYDKSGDIWNIDKIAKRIRRKKIENALDQINRQGYITRFAAGDKIIYEDSFDMKEGEIVRQVGEKEYEVKTASGNTIVIAEELIYSYEDLF